MKRIKINRTEKNRTNRTENLDVLNQVSKIWQEIDITLCNGVSPLCKNDKTACNDVSTQCKSDITACNDVSTQCKSDITACNDVSTQCSSDITAGNGVLPSCNENIPLGMCLSVEESNESCNENIPLGMCLSVDDESVEFPQHYIRDASLTGCGALCGGNDFLPRDASLTGCVGARTLNYVSTERCIPNVMPAPNPANRLNPFASLRLCERLITMRLCEKIKELHLGERFKSAIDRITFYPFLRLCETSKILITIGILILKSVIK